MPVVSGKYKVTRLTPGSKTRVTFPLKFDKPKAKLELELEAPPKGITISGYDIKKREVCIDLAVDEKAVTASLSENLIVNVIVLRTQKNKADPTKTITRKTYSGVLPAIPIEVVASK